MNRRHPDVDLTETEPMALASPQQVQEDFYEFPYHYLTALTPSFSISRNYDWGINYVSTMDFIVAQLRELAEPKSIIDIGCGDGRLTREMRTRFPDVRLAGVDYSERSIALANGLNHGSGISFGTADLINGDMAADFDAATLVEVYEHIPPADGPRFLEGVARLIRPGGTLLLTVPHVNVPVSAHHFRHFDANTLTTELGEKFDIVSVMPFEKMSSKRRWIQRLLVNRLFVLNHPGMLAAIYKYYMTHLFHAPSEAQCQRLYVKAIRR